MKESNGLGRASGEPERTRRLQLGSAVRAPGRVAASTAIGDWRGDGRANWETHCGEGKRNRRSSLRGSAMGWRRMRRRGQHRDELPSRR